MKRTMVSIWSNRPDNNQWTMKTKMKTMSEKLTRRKKPDGWRKANVMWFKERREEKPVKDEENDHVLKKWPGRKRTSRHENNKKPKKIMKQLKAIIDGLYVMILLNDDKAKGQPTKIQPKKMTTKESNMTTSCTTRLRLWCWRRRTFSYCDLTCYSCYYSETNCGDQPSWRKTEEAMTDQIIDLLEVMQAEVDNDPMPLLWLTVIIIEMWTLLKPVGSVKKPMVWRMMKWND